MILSSEAQRSRYMARSTIRNWICGLTAERDRDAHTENPDLDRREARGKRFSSTGDRRDCDRRKFTQTEP